MTATTNQHEEQQSAPVGAREVMTTEMQDTIRLLREVAELLAMGGTNTASRSAMKAAARRCLVQANALREPTLEAN